MISGRSREALPTVTGDAPLQRLGFDAVVVDDLNSDGHSDYLLSGYVLWSGDAGTRGNDYVVPEASL